MHFDYEISFKTLIDKIEDFWFAQSHLTVSFCSLNAFYSEPLVQITTDEERSVILMNDKLLLTAPSSSRVAVVVEADTDILFQFAVYDLAENHCDDHNEDFEISPNYRITIAKE